MFDTTERIYQCWRRGIINSRDAIELLMYKYLDNVLDFKTFIKEIERYKQEDC